MVYSAAGLDLGMLMMHQRISPQVMTEANDKGCLEWQLQIE